MARAPRQEKYNQRWTQKRAADEARLAKLYQRQQQQQPAGGGTPEASAAGSSNAPESSGRRPEGEQQAPAASVREARVWWWPAHALEVNPPGPAIMTQRAPAAGLSEAHATGGSAGPLDGRPGSSSDGACCAARAHAADSAAEAGPGPGPVGGMHTMHAMPGVVDSTWAGRTSASDAGSAVRVQGGTHCQQLRRCDDAGTSCPSGARTCVGLL